MLRTLIALSLVAAPAAALAQTQAPSQPQAQTQAQALDPAPDPDRNTRTLAEARAAAGESPEPTTLAASNTPPQKVRSVTVIGDQKCPKSSGGEIVVCSRIGQGDQYRIPDQFRQLPHPAEQNSWVNRAAVVDQVSREAAGLPDTCSVVGDGGQSGCAMQAFKQYSAEKRAQQNAQSSIP